MSSINDKAMAQQREQESFIDSKAKVNAEQSRSKGANKKKLFMDHNEDDDEFEVANSAYTMTDESIKKVNRENVFSSKSHQFEAVKATKEERDKLEIKKGMTAEDIAKMRGSFN